MASKLNMMTFLLQVQSLADVAERCLRVEPVVAHRLPHSPVLAQLRHTVLREARLRYIPGAIRGVWCTGTPTSECRACCPRTVPFAPDRSLPYSPASWVSFAGFPSVL